MQTASHGRNKNAGFSLITVAIGLTIASILVVSMLPGGNTTGTTNQKGMTAIQRLDVVETAIQGFVAKNGRLPCPADGQYDINNKWFGVEAAFPGSSSSGGGNCQGGTPAAPMGPDSGTGNVVAGVIPTKTLAIDDSYAFDQNGHHIAYYVDLRATLAASCVSLAQGGITIKTATAGSTITNVMHAFVIYGDGHGAFPEQGSTVANRVNTHSQNQDEWTNAGVDGSFTYNTTNFTNVLVRKESPPGSSFHDIVYYAEFLKNNCKVGISSGGSTNCTTPWSAPLANGNSVPAFNINSVVAPATCPVANTLSCASGVLSCSGGAVSPNCEYQTCSVGCTLPWGGTLANGGTSPAYTTGSVNAPATCPAAQTLTCNSGTLSCSDGTSGGSNDCTFQTCSVMASCSLPWGGSISNGSNVTAYQTATVPFGSTCSSQTRTCTAGSLSGTYTFQTCSVNPPANCTLPWGGTLNSGNTSPAYSTATVTTPATCPASNTLSCTNGVLSCSTGTVAADCEYQACAVVGGTALSGVRMDGATVGDITGWNVASGDVNGDGIPDLVINVPWASYGASQSGSTYVVFGTKSGFPDPLPLSSLNGTNGFRLDAPTANDHMGTSLAVGDINGDGVADIVIGNFYSWYDGLTSNGVVYVIYGGNKMENGTAWTTCPCKLTAGAGQPVINGTNGFRLDGASSNDAISSGLAIGDVNNDGYGDIIIGAQQASYNGATSGSVYVVYGAASGKMKDGTAWSPSQKLTAGTAASKPINGIDGIRLDGASAGDATGTAVATGDVNGDGIADLVIGSYDASYNSLANSGSVYVIYGAANLLPTTTVHTVLLSNTATVTSAAGLAVGQMVAASTIPNGTTITAIAGTTLTLSNSATGLSFGTPLTVITSRLTSGGFPIDGTDGFRLDGASAGDKISANTGPYPTGNNIAVRDVNGDGKADIIIGAPAASYNGASSGSTYVVYGGDVLLASSTVSTTNGSNAGNITAPPTGFAIGQAISSANFPAGTTITGLALSGAATFSNNATATAAGTPIQVVNAMLTAPGGTVINGTFGFRLDGATAGDQLGYSVAANDINRDGYADILMGAPFAAYGGGANYGSVYTVYGGPQIGGGGGWAGVSVLTSGGLFINGTNGFRLDDSAAENAGVSLVAGDINGDGYPDIIIGATASNANEGSVYVVNGQSCGYTTTNSLANVVSSPAACGSNSPVGIRIDDKTANDKTGFAITSGDVNGDGIPDLIISALGASNNGLGNSGSVYVIFGSTSGYPDPLPLSTLDSSGSTTGFRLDGGSANENAGWFVTTGDFNGDGTKDIIISAFNGSYNGKANSGSVYVVYGGATMKSGTAWSTCPCELNSGGSVINATNGFRLDGATASDNTGRGVAVGDVNGDGFADLIIGAPSTGAGAGRAYVVFGGGSGKMKDGTAWANTNSLALGGTIINGTNGFRLTGATAGDNLGWEVGGADIDADGKMDIILTAYNASYNGKANSGSVYVIYGGSTMKDGTAWANTNSLASGSAPINGADGFRLDGATASDMLGRGLAVGDVNGDGFADLVIGAYHASYGAAQAGSVYVVYGGTSGKMKDGTAWAATNLLTSGIAPINGTDGFRLDANSANENMGDYGSITTGDINADGKADMIIGSDNASYGAANSGSTYVVLGGATMADGTAWAATNSLNASGSIVNGTNGFRLDAPTASSTSGTGLAVVNLTNTTYPDIAIGNWQRKYNGTVSLSGAAWVYPGHASPWPTTFNLNNLCTGPSC